MSRQPPRTWWLILTKTNIKMKKTTISSLLRTAYALERIIPISKRGTYNAADPTCYEKGSLAISGDLILKKHDCTWGVEITLRTMREDICSMYISRGSFGCKDEIIFRDGFKPYYWRYFKKLLKRFPVYRDRDEQEFVLAKLQNKVDQRFPDGRYNGKFYIAPDHYEHPLSYYE